MEVAKRSGALEQLAAHLQRAHNTFARLAKDAVGKLQEASRAGGDGLSKLHASFLHGAAVTNRKIAKLDLQLSLAYGQVIAHFHQAHHQLSSFGRSVANQPRRLHETRLAKENDLRTLLASSVDAIIVTDNDRRLVAANSLGLDLFGVSELNMSKFTIGTFLSQGQIVDCDRNRPAFTRREERGGKCKIRRLDGTSRVAECIFIANVVPHRNLYRFLNVAPDKITQLKSPTAYTHDTRKLDSQRHQAS